MIFIARFTSPIASAIGLPSSSVIVSAISPARRSMMSSALYRMAPRFGAGMLAQSLKAPLAAAIAFSASCGRLDWNSPTILKFFAGFVIG